MWERKFKQGLNSKIRLTHYVNSGHEKESTGDFLLHCPQFVNKRDTFLSTIDTIDHKLLDNLKTVLSNTLLLRNTLCNSNESVLNRVGHVGLVGHSRGSFSWVILVGHSCGLFSWVILVGYSRGSFLWVILVGQTCGSLSWVKLVGHSWSFIAIVHSCASNSWVLWDPKIARQF